MDVVLLVCFILSPKHLAMTTMAPNAQLMANRLRHELEMAKQKIEWQQEMLKEMTKERDFLREQLAMSKSICHI